MDFSQFNSIIKESDEQLLLSDTQVEIPGPLQQLQKHLESLEEEMLSLRLTKSIASKEAARIINDELYQKLIILNEENRDLRRHYKEMMKDRQLKKENYYQEKREVQKEREKESSMRGSGLFQSSMRGSGIFSFSTSAAKMEHLTTPKHGYNRSIISPHPQQRKSFCPLRKNAVSSRDSFATKSKVFKNSEEVFKSNNIFLNLFSVIVEEEKQTEKELANYFSRQKMECESVGVTASHIHLSDMEKHLQQSLTKIEKMMELMKLYKDKLDKSNKECDQLQCIITEFSDAKTRLKSIYEKITSIPAIEREIQMKREYIQSHSTTSLNKTKAQSLQNLELLLKMLECSEGDQLQRIRQLNQQSSKLIVDLKQAKINQLIDSIRSGREKFKQIYNIYVERISALETKLLNFK